MVNSLYVKSLIFDIFDISKEIWNNYYNIDRNYSEDEIQNILNLIKQMDKVLEELEKSIK